MRKTTVIVGLLFAICGQAQVKPTLATDRLKVVEQRQALQKNHWLTSLDSAILALVS